MLVNFIFGLDSTHAVFLLICLAAVCIFEFINGFHDTANAVATVIYTKSLKPQVAVVWSGIWNFVGVFVGIGVAMKIIKLLPLGAMADEHLGESIAMVLAVLLSAIAWNLFTWYYGIPCSSSHTMIGALVGGGFFFSVMTKDPGVPWQQAARDVPWDKALEVGEGLLLAPALGFATAILMMLLMRWAIKNKQIFKAPEEGKEPPFWIRAILIGTCTGVSFAHGSNDGQKGVGLMLVILMGFSPIFFALNPQTDLQRTSESLGAISGIILQEADRPQVDRALYQNDAAKLLDYRRVVDSLRSHPDDKKLRVQTRKDLSAAIKMLEKDFFDPLKVGALSSDGKSQAAPYFATLRGTVEYAPNWVRVVIALCLGIGTMVGWKRIVVTIGEKIGKTHLTYAQGAAAELVAAGTIFLATQVKLPVSTTHILSSGVAGAMVASGGTQNLQRSTLTNIALAWVLTLPVTFVLAGLFFVVFRWFL
jgi:phosphate/sulfate permease